jgi:hypothetical protein
MPKLPIGYQFQFHSDGYISAYEVLYYGRRLPYNQERGYAIEKDDQGAEAVLGKIAPSLNIPFREDLGRKVGKYGLFHHMS